MKDIFYGMEKTSLVDFEGHIVATIFTKGCNFRCPYCHNSDLALNRDINPIPFKEIIEYLKSRVGIIDGVCVSGGEPTLHKELPYFIKEIKKLNILVKLDTNGSNPAMLKGLIDNKLIDYVAIDIKSGLSGYSKVIGKNSAPINELLESIKILKNSSIGYEFRTTLVKELHNKRDILEIGMLLNGEDKLYLQKFTDHGTCIEDNLHEVEKEKAQEYQGLLSKYIKNVYLRGY